MGLFLTKNGSKIRIIVANVFLKEIPLIWQPPYYLVVESTCVTNRQTDPKDLSGQRKHSHYVGHINLGERQASADYFGEYARVMPWRLRAAASEDFVAMLSNGACGDINNIDFNGTRAPREPFEQIRIVAAKVADASWRAIRDMEYFTDAPVAMRQREVPIDWRMPSKALLERSEKILAMSVEQQAELPRLEPLYARRVVNQSKRTGKADCLVQAIRIGDQAIVTLPFETFVEIGLEIKEKSPFRHNLVIELANGSYGYLPTPKHHELGGYETWLGTNYVELQASRKISETLLQMQRKIVKSSQQ